MRPPNTFLLSSTLCGPLSFFYICGPTVDDKEEMNVWWGLMFPWQRPSVDGVRSKIEPKGLRHQRSLTVKETFTRRLFLLIFFFESELEEPALAVALIKEEKKKEKYASWRRFRGDTHDLFLHFLLSVLLFSFDKRKECKERKEVWKWRSQDRAISSAEAAFSFLFFELIFRMPSLFSSYWHPNEDYSKENWKRKRMAARLQTTRKKRTFGPSINKKRKRRTKWTFLSSFLCRTAIAAIENRCLVPVIGRALTSFFTISPTKRMTGDLEHDSPHDLDFFLFLI